MEENDEIMMAVEGGGGGVEEEEPLASGSGGIVMSAPSTPTNGGCGDSTSSGTEDPSFSMSDTLSEREYSSDSGKGGSGSDTITLPYNYNLGNVNEPLIGTSVQLVPGTYPAYSLAMGKVYPTHAMIYEFDIPQSVVGRLIGRYGSFVNRIKEVTGANIIVKRHHHVSSLRICAVEGMCTEIDQALGMVRERFPFRKFPRITLEQVNYDGPMPQMAYLPANNKLNLIEGVINDITLSCVVSLDHIFVQQPTHPTYPALSRLHQALKSLYDQPLGAPKLVRPFNPGVICIAQITDDWFRSEVVAIDEEKAQVTARLVDVGGYVQVSIEALRQIRVDFVTIPFQATECRLANVTPINAEEGWSEEAVNFFKIIAQGHALQATVIEYSAKDGITLIHLYKLAEHNTHIFINQELVNHGYANWIDTVEDYVIPIPEVEQLCDGFSELGMEASSSVADSPNELSNSNWGDISSSDELTSQDAYHEVPKEPTLEENEAESVTKSIELSF